MKHIIFYLDFVSPYAYLAFEKPRTAGGPLLTDHVSVAIRNIDMARVHALLESRAIAYRDYPSGRDTAILDGKAQPGSNRRMRDQLVENKTPIYPVSMAAERAWDAAHGNEIHYMVGKEAERARFAARFFPNAMRKQIKGMMGDD